MAGRPTLLARPAVAVVGARSCSAYGAQVARELAQSLAAAGVVVVSGLARGVDAEAHRGALAAGGLTVAVLGCGIDRDYPRAHAELARRIAEQGHCRLRVSAGSGAVSLALPGPQPDHRRVWRRATVVVEARERSGALITADFALELGREVFAVPGEITSALSAGTNDLLRQGATPLLSADDVFESLGLEPLAPVVPDDLSSDARAVLERLSDGARTLDELVRATEIGTAAMAAVLTELELAGLIAVADGVYRRATGRGPPRVVRS